MFDFDVLRPDILVEPEALISRGNHLRRLAFLTPIRALPMKRPLLLAPDGSLGEAADLMMADKAPAALVVRDDSLLGLLRERDILRMVRLPEADLDRTSVWQAMTPEPPCCLDTDSVASALRSFRTHGIDHLPIVAEAGSPVGILDMSALVDWMSNQLTVVVFGGD
jgi:CBS domain-containing protein